jgi:lysozyme family protein
MAKFELFYPILEQNEGGYADKEGDSGGETWKGISRNNYPNWSGWYFIDQIKALPECPKKEDYSDDKDGRNKFYLYLCKFMNTHLRSIPELETKVFNFYKSSQWDPLKCDYIKNQTIAEYLADWGINAGLSVPAKHVQKILKLNPDGKVGPATLAAINGSDQLSLFTSLKTDRINFYISLAESKPILKQFLDTWLERADSFKFQE